jgi:hypothetical protein
LSISNVEALRKELRECLGEFDKLRPKLEAEALQNPQIKKFLALADKIKAESAKLESASLPKKSS